MEGVRVVMSRLLVILGVVFLFLGCKGEPGPWGNHNHEEAIDFLEAECYRHIHAINLKVQASGKQSLESVLRAQTEAQAREYSGRSAQAPSRPTLKTKEIRKAIKHWADQVPESDQMLTDTYKNLYIAAEGLGELYGLLDSPPEFNSKSSEVQGAMNMVWGFKGKLARRSEGFRPVTR